MDYSKQYKKVEKSIACVVIFDENDNVLESATGVVIGDGSKVLTCSHCCSIEHSTGIFDKAYGRKKKGSVIFKDDQSDIAIIQFDTKIAEPLKIVKSDTLEIGNDVFTIGFPYSHTSDKTLNIGNIAAFEDGLIKIDTSINNGNSGGPLLNMNGEIIGIVNSKLGRLSDFLLSIENQNSEGCFVANGIDPIQVINQIIREMQRNLNLGIGYAIPSNKILSVV